jgi:hypothetical protein
VRNGGGEDLQKPTTRIFEGVTVFGNPLVNSKRIQRRLRKFHWG